MKLTLSIENSKREDPIIATKTAFAHITPYIWLKSIEVKESIGGRDIVAVEWEKQAGSDSEDHEALIHEAISLRENMTLLEKSSIKRTASIPGLQYVESSDDGSVYRVLPAFAEYLALNSDARAKCSNQKVIDMKFGHEEVSEGIFAYNGIVSMTSAPMAQARPNAYNIFARIVQNDSSFREQILSGEISSIRLALSDEGTKLILVRAESEKSKKASSKQKKHPNDMDNFELIQLFTGVDEGWSKISEDKFIFRSTESVDVDRMLEYLSQASRPIAPSLNHLSFIELKKVFESATGKEILLAKNFNMLAFRNTVHTTFDEYWSRKEAVDSLSDEVSSLKMG